MNFIVLVSCDAGIGMWLTASRDILAFRSFESAEQNIRIALQYFAQINGVETLDQALTTVQFRILQVPESAEWVESYLADEMHRSFRIDELPPLAAGKIRQSAVKYYDIAETVDLSL